MELQYPARKKIHKNQVLKKGIGFLKVIYVRIVYNLNAFLQKRSARFKTTCFNFGLVLPENETLVLKAEDEKDRIYFQMYQYACRKLSLKEKTVLEIGSSVGGGCYFIHEYLQPKYLKGIDLIESQIKLAKKRHQQYPIVFEQGNACNLKEPENFYDVVVNIESSHGYPDFSAFLKGVYKALKKEGTMAIADIRYAYDIPKMEEDFISHGFSIQHQEDITKWVLKALDESDKTKREMLKDTPLFYTFFKSFAGLKGSRNYRYLAEGKLRYMLYILQKNG